MNILVLGSGGREHAIAWAIAKSPKCDKLFVAPGNGGTANVAENIPTLDMMDGDAVLGFVKDRAIDLVVIGPEAPLVAGVADSLRAAGVPVFGPSAEGAQLEGSKDYSKHFMGDNDIPTAAYATFTACEPALEYVREQGAPIVIKADGLAAGKGVVVAETLEDAEAAVRNCFDGAFGDAGSTIVIEECMTGPECSLLAFVSNGKAHCMATAQDHKRAFDGDKAPIRAAWACTRRCRLSPMMRWPPWLTSWSARLPLRRASRLPPTIAAFCTAALCLRRKEPKVVEYNVRFGDPETQVVLPRLESDLVDIMMAVAEGRPDDIELAWSDSWAVCVVLASEGYPGSYEKGKVILGIDEAEELEGVTVFHAGTALNSDGELITAGGRVLNVVALGSTFEEAREQAYRAVDLINFEGKQFRTDIGEKASRGRDAWE